MRFVTKLFRFVDEFTFRFFVGRIKKLTKEYALIDLLFIVGGGPSNRLTPKKVKEGKAAAFALLNYTKPEVCGQVDFLLLSDHYVFSFKNFFSTIKHINRVKPKKIIVPTRAIYSVLGLYGVFNKNFIFVKYYGTPLWKMTENVKAFSLIDELPSYDTVAYEFGFPLAQSLKVDRLVFSGVDLSYGEVEDASPFRVQWKKNICSSLEIALPHYSFSVQKICSHSYGNFGVYIK